MCVAGCRATNGITPEMLAVGRRLAHWSGGIAAVPGVARWITGGADIQLKKCYGGGVAMGVGDFEMYGGDDTTYTTYTPLHSYRCGLPTNSTDTVAGGIEDCRADSDDAEGGAVIMSGHQYPPISLGARVSGRNTRQV